MWSTFDAFTSYSAPLNTTIVEYFISLKIDRAKYLIANTNELFQNIALEVGYDDYYHFSKMFKKYTSYSPTEYKTLFKK